MITFDLDWTWEIMVKSVKKAILDEKFESLYLTMSELDNN